MQELLERIGILRFIKILIECWNEVFILLLLIMVLIEIYNYNKNKCIHTKLTMSRNIVIFYIIVLLFNLCGIVNYAFQGVQTYLARKGLQIGLCCYYVISAMHNIFLLQIFKKYLAEKIDMLLFKKIIFLFQVLQIGLVIIAIAAPVLFYQINGKNEFRFLWGHRLWQSISLMIFIFIGIVVLVKHKEIKHSLRAMIITADVFPLMGCIESFYTSLNFSNMIVFVMALIIFFLYEQNKSDFMIKNVYELEQTKILLAENRLSLEQSKNQTLMAQIQPHFINNSLMALRARCVNYPDIYESLTNFSLYLKSHFEVLRDTKTISFEQEMTNIEAYLALEQQNYKERLIVEYEIACDDFFIPALSVQPLVENAVRHGIGTYEQGGTVRIRTFRKDGKIVIEVIDDGSGKSNVTAQQIKRKGIGIENVKARLHAISGGKMEIISGEHGTTVRIIIEEKREESV